MNSVAYWLNETTTNLPFSDLFDTIATREYPGGSSPIKFIARPVQGGLYSLLALGSAVARGFANK